MNLFMHLTRPTKNNLACCRCRIVKNETNSTNKNTCPNCGHAMYNMGAGFVPPRQSDKNEWQKVSLLVKHNFTFEYLSA